MNPISSYKKDIVGAYGMANSNIVLARGPHSLKPGAVTKVKFSNQIGTLNRVYRVKYDPTGMETEPSFYFNLAQRTDFKLGPTSRLHTTPFADEDIAAHVTLSIHSIKSYAAEFTVNTTNVVNAFRSDMGSLQGVRQALPDAFKAAKDVPSALCKDTLFVLNVPMDEGPTTSIDLLVRVDSVVGVDDTEETDPARFYTVTDKTQVLVQKEDLSEYYKRLGTASSPKASATHRLMGLSGDYQAAYSMSVFNRGKFDVESFGVGGLNKEIFSVFSEVLKSRMIPPNLGLYRDKDHVKGLLLYGPPGTGKTLLARQLSAFLDCEEPIIVNGPELLNKYVGQSEENVRKLFEPAEKEWEEKGAESRLHVIVFDEIDALFQKRGSKGDNTGVKDGIVNQLLTKLDGVNQSSNFLVIGMTNRLDLLDPAMLRPGRFSVQIPVRLADRAGRADIFRIHTKHLRDKNTFIRDTKAQPMEDAELAEVLDMFAAETENYTGAEIANVIGKAVNIAVDKALGMSADDFTIEQMAEVNAGNVTSIFVSKDDIFEAIHKTHPMFGSDYVQMQQIQRNGWVDIPRINALVEERGEVIGADVRNHGMVSGVGLTVVHGQKNSGKSSFAVQLARASGAEFVKIVNAMREGSGFMEKMEEVFNEAIDALRGVIVIDNFDALYNAGERLLFALGEWMKGQRFPPHKRVALHVILVSDTEEFLVARELGFFSKLVQLTDIGDDSVIETTTLSAKEEILAVFAAKLRAMYPGKADTVVEAASEALDRVNDPISVPIASLFVYWTEVIRRYVGCDVEQMKGHVEGIIRHIV
ncbi:AAA+-type ATPase, SpoVK/Ycf46/Vps4 family [Carpediemonas membranifera]|uniref:Vesicle-fusing ATPase n=1 Tax=Carpediemonas membranifera TaxID=201153 RepID=A0A8J6E069_9EUKA|nr:AAA+-type ATPase, SpoVK/Ycf46/Vps4 family [Carpediemonas membranifera]|eukprot:KAG9394659.1 AAA+-type ATPase, SpoVK/Ycf46/Vps4 family [Carpediemonas membranifera]